MAEPPEFSARAHRHIPIDLWRETTAYAFPARNMRSKPKRDNYAAHAAALTQALAQALPPIPPRDQDPRVPIAGIASGAIIVMETRPLPERSTAKASKVPAGFDFATQDIVVLRSERRDDRTESAVVFVPDGARNFLSGRIAAYGRDPFGQDRPDQARFEVVERFVAAEALALFADPLVRDGPAVWWEYWIRAAPGRADVVAQTAAQRGLDVHPDRLNFPDTTVLLVHASADHALALAEATVGAVTEVRRSTETILPFLDRGDDRVGQADFVADLAARVTAAPRAVRTSASVISAPASARFDKASITRRAWARSRVEPLIDTPPPGVSTSTLKASSIRARWRLCGPMTARRASSLRDRNSDSRAMRSP